MELSQNIKSREWDLMIDEVLPGVFKIPTLTQQTCNDIITQANLRDWSTDRHTNAPTTDNMLCDISETLYSGFKVALDEYIHEMAEYCFNTVPDCPFNKKYRDHTFVAKYTPTDQSYLKLHHDGNSVMYTCNILLNGDFSGGGTYFPGDRKFNGTLIEPSTGEMIIHPGNIKYRHGSRPVTTGERYILISFIQFQP